jgi:hypothetical protein
LIPHIFLSKQIQTKWSNLISINFRSNLLHSNIDTPVNHYFQSQDNYSRIRVCLCWKVTSNIFFSFYFLKNIFFECISTLKLAINILDWKNLNYVYPSSIQTKQFKMHLDFETSYKHSRLKKSKLHFSFQISSVHSAKTFV